MLSEREKQLRLKMAELLPHLDERQRRLVVAAEAKAYGRGGITAVSRVTGISRDTIYRGIRDLEDEEQVEGIRKSGGGRKKLTENMPELLDSLECIIESSTRGDPESPLRWTSKSVRKIADELSERGFILGRQSVAHLLHELEYSLQANKKTSEGKKSSPDRDRQFQLINRKAKLFLKKARPVISVDTKKKELVGNYKNNGKDWRKKGDPIEVLSHDFPGSSVPRAIPYGVYDIGDNSGWVNIGITADTSEFAVESIRQWWKHMGKKRYPDTDMLYICADSGGSNGYRVHLWKYELQKLANETGLQISVSHYPPGTSKWNKVEHRLFSFISINWRGKPLTDYRTIIDLIASTKTDSGLRVKARLDKRKYLKGQKVPKEKYKMLNIKRNKFRGEWNYEISPQNV